MVKTNAVRLIELDGLRFRTTSYEYDENDLSGLHAASEIGMSPEQVFKTLVARGDKNGISVSHIEGYRSDTWILLDYVDVLVNVFSDEAREFYDLDRLWQDGKPVDLTGIVD